MTEIERLESINAEMPRRMAEQAVSPPRQNGASRPCDRLGSQLGWDEESDKMEDDDGNGVFLFGWKISLGAPQSSSKAISDISSNFQDRVRTLKSEIKQYELLLKRR